MSIVQILSWCCALSGLVGCWAGAWYGHESPAGPHTASFVGTLAGMAPFFPFWVVGMLGLDRKSEEEE